MKKNWMMIPCRSAHELLSKRMDGELDLADLARLRVHLAMCRLCSRVDKQMQLIRTAMRSLGGD